ncbi:protein-tyrosine phosphatase family protein [Cellulomonas endophytica]|uniref:protein-tyrosine phosphatase family protein n=1 Tax=Cellulomonas endophytica TaxID=2494735 RepID=UPI001011AB75|nr:dual specificity protein phosphatase family protein [Cellulomonas endophytica]
MTSTVDDATAHGSLTTEAVTLPGVRPADPPTHMVPGRLWHGGCPVDFDAARALGITAVVDVADADAHPPAGATDGLLYLKSPLVDGDDLPDTGLTLRLAALVAGLVDDGHVVLVHCTFGRNRSGLLVSLVVRELLGLSGAEALRHVQERREGTVNNAAFAAWLRGLPAPGGVVPRPVRAAGTPG